MKTSLITAIRLTLACGLVFAVAYPLLLLGVAQVAPNGGRGEVVKVGGSYYYRNVGQRFDGAGYFWSRPSAVDYNGAGSGGSNKGPLNPDYLGVVKTRRDSFAARHPWVKAVPVDMVTASGSGLDPHISIAGAKVQVRRVAAERGLEMTVLDSLVEAHVEGRGVNVLLLNLGVDEVSGKAAQRN